MEIDLRFLVLLLSNKNNIFCKRDIYKIEKQNGYTLSQTFNNLYSLRQLFFESKEKFMDLINKAKSLTSSKLFKNSCGLYLCPHCFAFNACNGVNCCSNTETTQKRILKSDIDDMVKCAYCTLDFHLDQSLDAEYHYTMIAFNEDNRDYVKSQLQRYDTPKRTLIYEQNQNIS